MRSGNGSVQYLQRTQASKKIFGHIPDVAEMPNLIEVQKASYDQFLMVDEPKGRPQDEGLQAVFKSVFPDFRFFRRIHAGIRSLRVRRRRNSTSKSAVSAI
jgi:DNA-directed RNA polymerase beta subunit